MPGSRAGKGGLALVEALGPIVIGLLGLLAKRARHWRARFCSSPGRTRVRNGRAPRRCRRACRPVAGGHQAHRHRLQIERHERRLIERLALLDADGFEDGVDTDQAEATEMLPAPDADPDHAAVVVLAQLPANAAAVGISRHFVLLLLVLAAAPLSAN